MSTSAIDILFHPDTFFRSVVSEREDFKFPILFVLVGAIVGAVTAYIVSGPTAQMMDRISPGLGAFTIVMALAAGFISAFFFWFLWAEIFFITSMILRKELIAGFNREFLGTILGLTGIFLAIITSQVQKNVTTALDTISILISLLSLLALILIIVSVFVFLSIERFKRPLEFAGYGYLPQILGSVISLIVVFFYIPKVSIPTLTTAALENPEMINAAIKALMHDPAVLEMTQITSLITIVFLLWSANIWIFGMKHIWNLSLKDAAYCVGIPVVAFAIYIIYNLGVM